MEKKMDFAAYGKRVRKMTEEQLRFIIRDATEAARCRGVNEGYYWDEVHVCAQELRRRGLK